MQEQDAVVFLLYRRDLVVKNPKRVLRRIRRAILQSLSVELSVPFEPLSETDIRLVLASQKASELPVKLEVFVTAARADGRVRKTADMIAPIRFALEGALAESKSNLRGGPVPYIVNVGIGGKRASYAGLVDPRESLKLLLPMKADEPDILSKSIRELGIRPRACYHLVDAGINTVGQLRGLTDEELLKIPGIGPVFLKNIKAARTAHGL